MNRREALLGTAALVGAAMMSAVAQAAEHDHTHHHGAADAALLTAVADCIQKGQVCLSHCLELLGQGKAEMAACSQSVNQMLALCTALQQLANQQSAYLPQLAAVAMDACKACEDECAKHADKHDACKACGDSCAVCYRECKKIAA